MRGIRVLVAVVWCAGCAGAGAPLPQTVSALPMEMPLPVESAVLLYECPDGFRFSARIESRAGGRAWLLLPDRTLELQLQEAASEVRYAADGVTLWRGEGEARLELDGAEHQACRTVPS